MQSQHIHTVLVLAELALCWDSSSISYCNTSDGAMAECLVLSDTQGADPSPRISSCLSTQTAPYRAESLA